TLITLVLLYNWAKASNKIIVNVDLRLNFMDLPETRDRHYKIWNSLYSVFDGKEESGSTNINAGIATQTSLNHLHNLITLVDAWNGPISVGVFTPGRLLPDTLQHIKQLILCHPKISQYVTFNLLLPLSHPPEDPILMFSITAVDKCNNLHLDARPLKQTEDNYDNSKIVYPVNALRNIAVKNLQTSHVFMIDIDMLPSKGLRHYLKTTNLLYHDEMQAFVIPAFEVKTESNIPDNKEQLLQKWEKEDARPFYYTVCWKCQKNTNYKRWRLLDSSTLLYKVDWVDPWEPFYIANRKFVHYDERFQQYGFNRISQLCDLHLKGADFFVLRDAFLIHIGFKDRNRFHSRKDEENDRNRILYRAFKKEKLETAVNGRIC
uniref:Beta-1,4-glucuronyltransferase 1 n=2 Tax=Clytia hemisphaerica TaxID=252671 RepID=A0A7M5UVN1_9CNID